MSLLHRAVRALGRQDLPAQIAPQIGSLTAVALAVLRSHAPRSEITPETVAFNKASQTISCLLPATEPA
ncbi:hypothetical protein [Streptomyces xanthochromogenes]|uniref:hypothetical protein n=1 Tax=Streptomyces xanthochromogenes TaxID=67384 RepID=UPI0038006E11